MQGSCKKSRGKSIHPTTHHTFQRQKIGKTCNVTKKKKKEEEKKKGNNMPAKCTHLKRYLASIHQSWVLVQQVIMYQHYTHRLICSHHAVCSLYCGNVGRKF